MWLRTSSAVPPAAATVEVTGIASRWVGLGGRVVWRMALLGCGDGGGRVSGPRPSDKY